MLKEYHQLLSDSTFVCKLFELDKAEAKRYHQAGCPVCAGKLDRADYERRPRGLQVELSVSQRRRISFCCRSCRRRTSPESIVYLRAKIYAFAAVFLTLSFCSGRMDGVSIRRACCVSGASEVTLRRWRGWIDRFLASPQWRLLKARLSALLCTKRFPYSLLREFAREIKSLPEAVCASLRYLWVLSVRIY